VCLCIREFKQRAVKGGDKLDLGGGHVMEFVMAPNLHWPDTMFSFDHGTGEIHLP
jgi:flavorubredoxin